MIDSRIRTLANNLVNQSLKLKKGEKVLIDTTIKDTSLANALIDEAYKVGALPFVNFMDNVILRKLLMHSTKEQWETKAKTDTAFMEMMDAYVAIRGFENVTELVDVPSENLTDYQKYWLKPVHSDIRVPFKKWVVLRWPSPSFAQSASMSTDAFEDLYFNVCNLDYEKMDNAMNPLKELMEKTNMVKIKGVGTDLTFSIKDIPVVKCSGARNIPDGEVYTAPVKNSVNGKITYTAKTLYQGTVFENVTLEFKEGKIINANAMGKTDRLNEILDTDEGARYVGEFSLGFNPYLENPMLDILFDEKIAGSFHFTPGRSYETADNGNKSSIHWDMVCIQTEKYGGGEIYFDDVLIRKDGFFVLPELQQLNPENLK